MKTFIILILLVFSPVNFAIIKDQQKTNQTFETPKRKLSNSPYLNAFDDFSTKPLGVNDNQTQTSMAATGPGTSQASINAALPLTGTSMSPYLNTMPHPMMNPMLHPLTNPMLNPMHPGNPISPFNPVNQTLTAEMIEKFTCKSKNGNISPEEEENVSATEETE